MKNITFQRCKFYKKYIVDFFEKNGMILKMVSDNVCNKKVVFSTERKNKGHKWKKIKKNIIIMLGIYT